MATHIRAITIEHERPEGWTAENPITLRTGEQFIGAVPDDRGGVIVLVQGDDGNG